MMIAFCPHCGMKHAPHTCCVVRPNPAKPATCENCKYFKETSAIEGLCRRFPPAFIEVASRRHDSYPETIFANPMTDKTGWCGEYVEASA